MTEVGATVTATDFQLQATCSKLHALLSNVHIVCQKKNGLFSVWEGFEDDETDLFHSLNFKSLFCLFTLSPFLMFLQCSLSAL